LFECFDPIGQMKQRSFLLAILPKQNLPFRVGQWQ